MCPELARELFEKYSQPTPEPYIVRPMARNAAEVKLLLEGELMSCGVHSTSEPIKRTHLTAKEAGILLGIAPSHVRYYAKTGSISKDGGLFLLTSVMEFKAVWKTKKQPGGFSLSDKQKQMINEIVADPSFSYSRKTSKSLKDAAQEFGVSRCTLGRAIKQAINVESSTTTEAWTKEEIERLTYLCERHIPSKIPELFNSNGYSRSSNAINKKISQLKLSQKPCYAEEFTLNSLVSILGASRRSVYANSSSLNIVKYGGRSLLSRDEAIKLAMKIPSSKKEWFLVA